MKIPSPLTAATKKGNACQNGVKWRRNVAANICCKLGSPIAWPIFSTTAIAAYSVALESSEIQYEMRDNVETLLPKPAANTKTP